MNSFEYLGGTHNAADSAAGHVRPGLSGAELGPLPGEAYFLFLPAIVLLKMCHTTFPRGSHVARSVDIRTARWNWLP